MSEDNYIICIGFPVRYYYVSDGNALNNFLTELRSRSQYRISIIKIC